MREKVLISGLLLIATIVAVAFMPLRNKADNKGSSSNGTGQGIQFIESDWNKALEQAKLQNKLIFLDAYASWCGPCKMLKRSTFQDKEAGEFFNKNFINVAVDMEKGVGLELAERYGVSAYPTLIVTDSEGKMVTYTRGYMDSRQLIDFGRYGLSKKIK
jgi:thioredoxin 1